MIFTAEELCNYLEGKLEGAGKISITHPAKIEEASEGAVSFLANQKYAQHAYTTNASALIVSFSQSFDLPVHPTLIRVENPYASFTKVLEKFNKPFDALVGIAETAVVDASAQIGKDVFVGALSYIGRNVKIGNGVKIFPQVFLGDDVVVEDGTVLFSGVRVYRECRIGKDCTLHSGVVIGSDGFGFAPQENGVMIKVPQLGNVVIEGNVEIGANTTIDRATMGSTFIRKGVKIDNLVHVAHNVEIGEHTAIAAQTGISGSTKIGKHCQIGGQVGLVGHLVIADGTRINAQSGVSKSITENNKAVTGSPAFDYTAALRSQAIFRNLPELLKRIDELESRVKQYEMAH